MPQGSGAATILALPVEGINVAAFLRPVLYRSRRLLRIGQGIIVRENWVEVVETSTKCFADVEWAAMKAMWVNCVRGMGWRRKVEVDRTGGRDRWTRKVDEKSGREKWTRKVDEKSGRDSLGGLDWAGPIALASTPTKTLHISRVHNRHTLGEVRTHGAKLESTPRHVQLTSHDDIRSSHAGGARTVLGPDDLITAKLAAWGWSP
ncbi:uncharacterized protein MYCFIDRAFT_201000 [Pseudocercospora fijiensis CIRAD86]|uniref:Uncharacterized protein n=1 Tax=Pseudocercospora fijiensis (strain CIRAD86) TaxID=383855 RepID=M2ZXF8_PSEFD|nr:uncharacterized protein MYCFIDRAFT_201000 [Pseudocercospora fijiensis CIRAD86]EME76756.1 hypothetical protein MYCFIDRAFT_201000 [Pseudocercospora fijiensis CIRAD86]